MTTLPPGWAADYDGSRWFFVYKPTGHFQYQFPTPGDEFPDFGGGLALGLGGDFPVTELSPEERLESERQLRRQSNFPVARKERDPDGENKQEAENGAVGRKGVVEAGKDDDDNNDDGSDAFSFESFGYFGPTGFGHEASAGCQERSAASVGKRLPRVSPPTSVANTNTPRASISEPSAIETLSVTGETAVDTKRSNSSPTPCPPSDPDRTRPLAVAEPAVPAAKTTTSPPPSSQPHGGVTATATELPMLDGRAIDSVPRMLTFSPSRFMPELYSELTALCEEEINPPPVELPDNGASWLEPVPVPNLVNQYPVELPADGKASSRDDVYGAGVEPNRQGIASENGDDKPETKLNSKPDREVSRKTGSQTNMDCWATLLPPKPPPKEPLDEEALHREIMGYFPEHSVTPAAQTQPVLHKQASFPTATETRSRNFNTSSIEEGLTHVPSVLRPGPRRSSQPPLQQAPATTLPLRGRQTGGVQQQDHRTAHMPRTHTMPVELPSQASFRSVPIGPSVDMPRPLAGRQPAAAAVNFVIPIDHRHGSAAGPEKTPASEYHVSATSASQARYPPEPTTTSGRNNSPPRTENKPPLLMGKRGHSREEDRQSGPPSPEEGRSGPRRQPPASGDVPPQLAPGGPTKETPEWSWGYAT
ncbi:hypothetical protein VM1G_07386 [Cytospora mali]|uniref:WW domain-containing protein n=1 Tax=Cytospora mali TaxID=578113 RepID=A0A194W5R3_CYTMA|nr:hypothetical protein VM1G_07386 [Valsa mali]